MASTARAKQLQWELKPEHELGGPVVDTALTFIRALRRYHTHEVVGLENIADAGSGLLVVNHSLATYDIALLLECIYTSRGRAVRSAVDHLFFKLPLIAEWVSALGGIDGNAHNARSLLGSGEILCVAPGGMREALRPSSQRYQLRWERRRGFIRLAIETQTPIILAVCPRADDLYEVYDNPFTDWVYRQWKLPLVLARGLGPSPIPRPVKLTHFVSEPLVPPKPLSHQRRDIEAVVRPFHQKVLERAQLLMAQAIAHRS